MQIEGPAFEALELKVDPQRGEASLRLDDGSEERVEQDALGMDELTGRFECRVRSGRARAVLSRSAHNGLLEHVKDGDHLEIDGARGTVRHVPASV